MANAPYRGGSPYTFNPTEAGNIPIFGIPLPHHAGVAPRPDTGYDTNAVKISKRRRDAAEGRFNARLHDGTWYVDFFVNKLGIDVGLAGSTAQSRFTRDFYPHNMVMPSFVVEGQCLDQNDYGTLVEFVHQAQQKGVYNSSLLQLDVAGNGLKVSRPIMRGRHKPVHAQGFIRNMKRKHERFVYAPKFTFSFIVSTMFSGIYQESTAPNLQQESWAQILAGLVARTPLNEEGKEEVSSSPPFAGGLGKPGATSTPPGNEKAQNEAFGPLPSEVERLGNL